MLETRTFEDVTQIRMSREIDGKPIYWVAAYLVDGLLVDTGCYYTADELLAFLENRRVDRAVNTHFHEDHIGANRKLQELRGIEIFAPTDSVPLIAQKIQLHPYQEAVWGTPSPTTVIPLPDSISTPKYTFEVIDTPGHSVGHVALLEKSRGWCFSADIFARENPKFIRPEENMTQTVNSMRLLIQTDATRLVLFTSVGKIVENGRKALQSFIDYIEDLAEKSKKRSHEGRSVDEIVNHIFGGEHSFAEMTNGQYTSENLIRSVLEMP
jgi:glyoxylase-like metal-dependent hydrolase (beta-lactamase superfamily II)